MDNNILLYITLGVNILILGLIIFLIRNKKEGYPYPFRCGVGYTTSEDGTTCVRQDTSPKSFIGRPKNPSI